MKKNIRLFSTFIMSLLLCIVVTLAWYVVSEDASVSGIVVNVGDVDYEYEVYAYENNTWQQKNGEITFLNAVPNDVFYYALKIYNTTENIKFTARFDGIKSSLINDKLTALDSGISFSEETDVLYNYSDENKNKVYIDGKVLYNVLDGKISLGDYLINDVFRLYVCNSLVSDNDYLDSLVPQLSGDSKLLDEKIVIDQQINKEEIYYLVFALEFNETVSLVDGNSNCYQFQTLTINNIILSASKV